jgi:biopolymer transport protein ExbD
MSVLRETRRRRISMTSLVDVIFLLLLFFMLTSTFTRFSEVELAAGGAPGATAEARPHFLQLGPERATLDGAPVALADLGAALPPGDGPRPVLVALRGEVTAQRLTDLLVVLRGLPQVRATVLGPS